MGALSFWHILVVVIVVGLVFAHRQLPALLGALGRMIGHFRKAGNAARRPPDNVIEGTFERRDD
jgi:Sec-independent protein translocase protein TatA